MSGFRPTSDSLLTPFLLTPLIPPMEVGRWEIPPPWEGVLARRKNYPEVLPKTESWGTEFAHG